MFPSSGFISDDSSPFVREVLRALIFLLAWTKGQSTAGAHEGIFQLLFTATKCITVKRNMQELNSASRRASFPGATAVFHVTSVRPDEGAILGILNVLKVSGVRAR